MVSTANYSAAVKTPASSPASRALFLLCVVQFTELAIGIENGRRQGLGKGQRLGRAQVQAGRSGAAKDRQAAFEGNDLAARPAPGSIGPAANALVEVEEERHHR